MNHLLPDFIYQNAKDEKHHGFFDAYTMFVDLSGFTKLTELLMKKGASGAEELSAKLNDIFSPIISMVYQRKGYIPYFAGDAFTAIFPISNEGIRIDDFVQTAIEISQFFQSDVVDFEDFRVGAKIGLSKGLIEWGIVGDEALSYYFRGPAIDDCAECQKKAHDQEIILDEGIVKLMSPEFITVPSLEDGYFLLLQNTLEGVNPTPFKTKKYTKEIVQKFMPNSLLKKSLSGEFRSVVSIFISFKGVTTHEDMNAFASVVLSEIDNFSGYFKEIDFGDKGGVLVCFFGAPVTFENNTERALEFVSTVQERLIGLAEQSELKFRIGITAGLAFTGLVGGQERSQYAAVGNRVNLSARLMTYANWGEVLVDETVQKDKHFKFRHKGDIQYKGITGSVPTFKYLGKNTNVNVDFIGDMVGRDQELKGLVKLVEQSFKNKKAAIATIYGEAGIGKSRLTFELQKQVKNNSRIDWYTCQADQILKKPLNPFIYFLKNYFSISSENTLEENEKNFEQVFNVLRTDLAKVSNKLSTQTLAELDRTKPVFKSLVGLSTLGTFWEKLDAKARYENRQDALASLIIAEGLLGPCVFQLEDGHWFDKSSLDFLNVLLPKILNLQISLITTSRYDDDGTKYEHFSQEVYKALKFSTAEVDLNILSNKVIKEFAERKLEGVISKEFHELLIRASNGNPFYLEQIIEYFKESNLLKLEKKAWQIKDKRVKLSTSINSILTARIDRLSGMVKETVKAAAVIGREFDIPILSEVMRSQTLFVEKNGNLKAVLKEQVDSAEKVQIWQAMNELRYIFKHSLLREAVYSMQLTTRLKDLHRSIAEAIERLHAHDIEEHYLDLAFHFENALILDKTQEYLSKAANYARRNFQNQQALQLYDKLLKLLTKSDDKRGLIKTMLKKGQVLVLIGEWEACEILLEEALVFANDYGDANLIAIANSRIGHLWMLRGSYSKARTRLEASALHFEEVQDAVGLSRSLGDLGNLYFRQGNYEYAKKYFIQSIDWIQSKDKKLSNPQIAANLGLTHMNQGEYDEGIAVQKKQLKVSKKLNDKSGMATLHTNLGIVYYEKGDYERALKNYEKGLKLSQELGNKLLTSIAIGCIGSVYQKQGDYAKAMDNFDRDLVLTEELGDKQGIAIALGLIGNLLSEKGDFDKAIYYLEKNLAMSEELGYLKGAAKALNTLGDVYFFKGEHEESIKYYDKAITLSRQMKNQLLLVESLIEKCRTLLQMDGKLITASRAVLEAEEVAQDLGNPDQVFDAQAMKARILAKEGKNEKAENILLRLKQKKLSRSEKATVYYGLYQLTNAENYRQKALGNYKKLFKQTPKYQFKTRVEELS